MTLTRARLLVVLAAGLAATAAAQDPDRRWLAGDSHIHSQWSPRYDRTKNPPVPLKGEDAIYPTPINAQMARKFGLSWMVTTDHGGPNHSKFNREQAYPELQASRTSVPDVLQFYGMEINFPAMDHHTLIMPRSAAEAAALFDIESRFDANDAWPRVPARNTETAALDALLHLQRLSPLPLMFANHPSRSAKAIGMYGLNEPRELRRNHDAAPEVYRGMEGAPGHQAVGLSPDGSPKRNAAGEPVGARGGYSNPGAGTLGGFDQMTAVVGGLWDSLLGEGRRFWIVATSDSHVHHSDTAHSGSDFWPGEFHKTYVLAHKTYDDVLGGLREGRVFAVAGDLITELEVEARAGRARAGLGETLPAAKGATVKVRVRFRDPGAPNAHGDRPSVNRVDVIVGDILGPGGDPAGDRNPSTRVIARVDRSRWKQKGEWREFDITLPALSRSAYVRLRGTNGADLEPLMDAAGENPWLDLWFYSNPVFIDVR